MKKVLRRMHTRGYQLPVLLTTFLFTFSPAEWGILVSKSSIKRAVPLHLAVALTELLSSDARYARSASVVAKVNLSHVIVVPFTNDLSVAR